MKGATQVEERIDNRPDWVVQYEALRTHALGNAPAGFIPLGLGVVLRRGLPEWMTFWNAARRAQTTAVEEVEVKRRRTEPANPSELVHLLAGTALLVTQGRSG